MLWFENLTTLSPVDGLLHGPTLVICYLFCAPLNNFALLPLTCAVLTFALLPLPFILGARAISAGHRIVYSLAQRQGLVRFRRGE